MRSNDSQKIIVVGIPKTLDDAQLSELFSEFGAVAEAKVVLDAASNSSRGFGFVTFTAGSAMRAAIKGMNKKVIQGRTLNVRQLVPKDQFQAQKKEAPDASQRPCWLLRKGKCTKGDNCPFSHDIKDGEFGNCFEFVQTGVCKRGDKCKFSHPQKTEEGEDDEKKENVKSEAKPVEKRVCYSFQNGRCHRGKKCLYAHELLVNGEQKNEKKNERVKKQPFEVVNEKSEAGKKRKRPEETESEEEVESVKQKKPQPAAAGLAAHVNNFMASQKPVTQQKPKSEPKQMKQQSGPKKFEWKAKVQPSSQKQERQQVQVLAKEEYEVQEEVRRPVKKIKTEKIDMGAAFDGVSDDESGPVRGGKKKKVDKETMRANREKLKQDRRAKRSAKKTALSKLLTKGEVELGV
ncbi:hypothetical protein F441_06992 [Phytophthora nicotianae CJ01A1]|uniref:Uncharacterized protein n=3 Tax=Phytophthora nicotianae TaxID=4792 RepID=V9FF95_PHYNI|nr:hypothetical protein F443_06980 [Phytophthora nicotianae P1569]ETK88981.1 hypothetical protein L915_06859 [Phytophthora nicotianae]ETL42387.1 hypothetical protein L916_06802 [Phytophthora nicotianae]ETM48754.1 hypothetical protein L914_06767 [Phytophthora nicotianae]ETP18857.1 hypothetical protein F441_06992 [Phytophthora nicotianae CJ01A1]